MATSTDLADFAAATCQRLFTPADRIAAARAELTSLATKTAFARRLVEGVTDTFAVPVDTIDGLAARLADPATRVQAEREILACPFADPSITFAGIGISLALDAVFADNGGTTHIVAIPAYWSRDLWHFERDLAEDGYHYGHWVYATLPASIDWDQEVPIAYTLVSDQIYGRLHWGDRIVHLYRGEVNVEPDYAAKATNRVFDAALEPVH